MIPYYIYSLHDPTTHEIRYVGATPRPLNIRLSEHISRSKMSDALRPIDIWIRELQENSLIPYITLIEECSDLEWEQRERHHIKRLRVEGRLLNRADGGKGYTGGFHQLISTERMSETRRKQWQSPDHRRNRIAIGKRYMKLTDEQAREILNRTRAGEDRFSDLAKEYGVSYMTIVNIYKRKSWKWLE